MKQVYLQWHRNTWFVCYVQRKRGTRYTAAQFYGGKPSGEFSKGNARQAALNWIASHSNLELVQTPADAPPPFTPAPHT